MTQETGSKIYLYCICGVAVIGGLLFGYDTAVISGGEQALQKYFQGGTLGNSYSTLLHGFVSSSALVGCVIGGMICGFMASRLGRRNSLIVASILFFLSALGSYWPEFLFYGFDFENKPDSGILILFILYRVLGGVGVGLASAICPMYIAEVSPPEIRGTLVSCNQFAIIFGQLLVYVINTFIRGALGDNDTQIEARMVEVGWRRMFVSECVPAGLFGILLLFVPKTPRYLIMKGNEERASKVLTRINGSAKANEVLNEIKDTIKNEKEENLFSYGKLVVVVGVLLSFFQQAVGINVALYYAPRIFQGMGSSGNSAMIQTVVMGIVNIIFTVVAIFTVDKWGRKPLLTIGSFGMALGMFVLSVLSFSSVFSMKVGSIFGLVFMIVYTASFMMSWGPICWVLISEIFPNTIRANAVAWAVAAQWISNLIVSMTFPYIEGLSKDDSKAEKDQKTWGAGIAYLMYGGFSLLSAYFVYKLVPETKGKTLEDMTELWLKKKMERSEGKDVLA